MSCSLLTELGKLDGIQIDKQIKIFKKKPPTDLYEESNPFLDWAADHFIFGGHRYIIVSNCATLLCWAYSAKGVNSSKKFAESTAESIKECMEFYEFDEQWERFIAPSIDEVHFRKVGDPKMSGNLTDFVRTAKLQLHLCPGISTQEISRRQKEVPQLKRKEIYPIEAFIKLSLP
jgi:hypothetical protein